ncbi:MAG: hypothetical protein ACK4EX_06570 [Thermaurantimonas sp.]|uniref:hypothetical protein n=1 Tax=Thermaurantimonas sp. TaxID=2681568 RepID=UPI00391B2C22
MKNLLTVGVMSAMCTIATAQKVPYSPGNKAFSLGVNGIFNYAGNMFSPNFNTLNIPIANNYIFRRFDSETSAHRYEINGMISSNEGLTENFTFRNNELQLSFLWGKEKHWLYREINVYRYYGFGGGFQYNSQNSEGNLPNQPKMFSRVTNGPTLFIPLQLGVGLEHHFAKHFFIGIEGGLTGRVAYTFRNVSESWNELTPDEKFIAERKDIFQTQIRFINSLIFRAGFKF